jgi:DNA-binding MltR family transcriptional regulator
MHHIQEENRNKENTMKIGFHSLTETKSLYHSSSNKNTNMTTWNVLGGISRHSKRKQLHDFENTDRKVERSQPQTWPRRRNSGVVAAVTEVKKKHKNLRESSGIAGVQEQVERASFRH